MSLPSNPFQFLDDVEDDELDEPEVYLWEDDQGYPLGCSCACSCCGCNMLCDESQILFEEED